MCDSNFVCVLLRLWDPVTEKWDVTGMPDALRQTSAYPAGFGRAVVKCFKDFGHCGIPSELDDSVLDIARNVSISDIMSPVDTWADAFMLPVVRFVKGECPDMCSCLDCAHEI